MKSKGGFQTSPGLTLKLNLVFLLRAFSKLFSHHQQEEESTTLDEIKRYINYIGKQHDELFGRLRQAMSGFLMERSRRAASNGLLDQQFSRRKSAEQLYERVRAVLKKELQRNNQHDSTTLLHQVRKWLFLLHF